MAKTKTKETPKAVAPKAVEVKKVDPVEVLAEKIYIQNVNLQLGQGNMKICAGDSKLAASVFYG